MMSIADDGSSVNGKRACRFHSILILHDCHELLLCEYAHPTYKYADKVVAVEHSVTVNAYLSGAIGFEETVIAMRLCAEAVFAVGVVMQKLLESDLHRLWV